MKNKLGLQTLGILVKESWGKFGDTRFFERQQLLPLYLLQKFYKTNLKIIILFATVLGQVSIKKYCSK